MENIFETGNPHPHGSRRISLIEHPCIENSFPDLSTKSVMPTSVKNLWFFLLGWQVDVNAFLHFSVQYKKTMPPWNFFQLREFRVGFDKRQVGQLRMHLIPISLSLGVWHLDIPTSDCKPKSWGAESFNPPQSFNMDGSSHNFNMPTWPPNWKNHTTCNPSAWIPGSAAEDAYLSSERSAPEQDDPIELSTWTSWFSPRIHKLKSFCSRSRFFQKIDNFLECDGKMFHNAWRLGS